jgi:hypothetical protein
MVAHAVREGRLATILAFTKADKPARCSPAAVSELVVFPRTTVRALHQLSQVLKQSGPDDAGKSTRDHKA